MSEQKRFKGLRAKHRKLRGKLGIKSFRVELTVVVFGLMFITSGFTVGLYALLLLLFPSLRDFDSIVTLASSLIACTLIGTCAAAVFTKWVLLPLNEMIHAIKRISKGDFKVHIQETFHERSDFGILQLLHRRFLRVWVDVMRASTCLCRCGGASQSVQGGSPMHSLPR